MVTLPRLRCPNCGKAMGPIKAQVIPPANTFEDCLRQCPRCLIGATNAKNPAKVKFIYVNPPQETPDTPPQDNTAQETPAEATPPEETPSPEVPPQDIPPQKP